jgi:hypothetical protein
VIEQDEHIVTNQPVSNIEDNAANDASNVEKDTLATHLTQARVIGFKQIKPRTLLRFRKEGATDWIQGRVHSRAGKATTVKSKGP